MEESNAGKRIITGFGLLLQHGESNDDSFGAKNVSHNVLTDNERGLEFVYVYIKLNHFHPCVCN